MCWNCVWNQGKPNGLQTFHTRSGKVSPIGKNPQMTGLQQIQKINPNPSDVLYSRLRTRNLMTTTTEYERERIGNISFVIPYLHVWEAWLRDCDNNVRSGSWIHTQDCFVSSTPSASSDCFRMKALVAALWWKVPWSPVGRRSHAGAQHTDNKCLRLR